MTKQAGLEADVTIRKILAKEYASQINGWYRYC